MNHTYPLIIGGKRIYTKKCFTVENPANNQRSHKFCVAGQAEIDLALKEARTAQIKWAETSYDERIKLFKNLEEIFKKKAHELSRISTFETGKTPIVSVLEIATFLQTLDFYVPRLKKFLCRKNLGFGSWFFARFENYITYSPVGVVAVLVPWNWPISLSAFALIPSILAGNTVLYKPSEFAGYIGYKITELFEEAGFPPGVINLLNGTGPTTGDMVTRSDVDKVIFTGGTVSGKKVAQNCAEKLTPAILELGGLDPMIVCEDCNLDFAVKGAVYGNYINSGQTCVAPKRLFVHINIFDQFVKKVVAETRKLRVGSPLEKEVDVGPLAHRRQFEKVMSFIEDAVSKGAKVECGGTRIGKKGYFVAPTVLTNLKPDMLVLKEEPFGPIMPIIAYYNDEQAIEMANDTIYGLGASVWSKNTKKAEKIAERINAGTVWINESCVLLPQMPFGGIKKSGNAKELGKIGLREFVYMKSIMKNASGSKPRPWWFPLNKQKTELNLNVLVNYMHSHTLINKIIQFFKIFT